MSETSFFNYLLIIWFALAGTVFIVLYFVVAPYGRHITKNHGPSLKSSTGWIIMECSSPIIFAACFISGQNLISLPAIALVVLWETHYIHRAFFYPFNRRDGARRIPVIVVALGFVFNSINSYLNGRYIFTLSPGYPDTWLSDPRFIMTVMISAPGFQNKHTGRFQLT